MIGETRLWYESLTPIANDWPALQNNFRRQYSKLCNTPEQHFHQWRSFTFNENTYNIDSYVTKVGQCAAFLNYGELQILELLKNTLSSRLYPILFPVDNLRDAVTKAKRVLTKEMIDRQKSGQSSAIPFMRVSDSSQPFMRASKKGVTFDVMDTIERNSDSIDKLTSLASKMNVKLDKKEALYKPQIYQGRPRSQSRNRQNNYQSWNRSFSRNRNQSRNRGNYNNRNNYRSNYRDRSRDNYRHDNKRNNYWSNDRQNNYRQDNRRDNKNRQNYGKNDTNKGIEIEVRVGEEITIVTIQETEVGVGIETDKCDQKLECYPMKDETDQGLTLV